MSGDVTICSLRKPRLGCRAMREEGRDPDFKVRAASRGQKSGAQRGICSSSSQAKESAAGFEIDF